MHYEYMIVEDVTMTTSNRFCFVVTRYGPVQSRPAFRRLPSDTVPIRTTHRAASL